MKSYRTKNHGFTIVELMLASAVFSLVLMIALAGFLQIGHLFYKGVSTTSTQNINRQIVDDVITNIQTASGVNLQQQSNTYSYYCIGNYRYTFSIGNMLDLSQPVNYSAPGNTASNFGIIKDQLPGSTPCAAPCNTGCTNGAVAFNNPVELLNDKMRVEDFTISQPNAATSPNLYTVTLKIVYGDDNSLNNISNPNTIECAGNLSNQQFCSVSSITSSIYKGYGS